VSFKIEETVGLEGEFSDFSKEYWDEGSIIAFNLSSERFRRKD
jgi:hypothetical protein